MNTDAIAFRREIEIAKRELSRHYEHCGDFSTKLGRIGLPMGEVAEFVTYAQWLTQIDTHLAHSYMNRAVASVRLGNSQVAIDDCTEAIRLRRDFTDAYRVRSQALRTVGRHARLMKTNSRFPNSKMQSVLKPKRQLRKMPLAAHLSRIGIIFHKSRTTLIPR